MDDNGDGRFDDVPPNDGNPDGSNVLRVADRFTGWTRQLILNKDGNVRPVFANALTALRGAPEWQGVLRYNQFAQTAVAYAPPPWVEDRAGWKARIWSDDDDSLTTEWVQRQGIFIKSHEVASAVQTVALENKFNPVQDYLNGLTWDGENRIEEVMPAIFGAESNAYTRAVFRCFLVSAVARAMQPGCKVDTVLIMEGDQGLRKSTAMLELFGSEFFTDDMPDLGTKDAAITAGSAWCIELAELTGMQKKDVEVIKAFITRRIDNFRPPYGRRNVQIARQCILVGSSNDDAYLKDATGGRRFWPVRCGAIDIERLKEARDALWAEAVALYRLGPGEGGEWWLIDADVQAMAKVEQDDRYEGDPWEPLIADWVDAKAVVTVEDILMKCLEVAKSDLTTAGRMRVAKALKRAGWVKDRRRLPGQKGPVVVWVSPGSASTPDMLGGENEPV